ncbi:MAG: redoxin domain-containing protein [Candidatus Marinimicrobia bacterium]|nr:redoxin domain-containing protein [Candidatus Neomarinimicrobiota bacterium]MCF7904637.1 redoxin domain-containing protein [Candidatus Neomarinimicrobiota bacterium]
MKKLMSLVLVAGLIVSLNVCSQKEEISEERFIILTDTLLNELEFEEWMDFAYELAKNYPEKYEAAVILAQGSERALMENDSEQFSKFYGLLKNYPENGALEMSDQIAIGNQLAWIMSTQNMLPNMAQEVIEFTIKSFNANADSLEYRDQIGAAVYATQAVVYSSAGDQEGALEAYSASIDHYEQPEALIQRALILEEQGDLSAALEDFVTALGLSPNQPMLTNKVKELYTALNPGQDATQFINDLQVSLNEKRREQVLAETIYLEAPQFSFSDFSGKTYTNMNQMGKVVFVDFWATWCGPCRRELPEFQKFYEMHKNDPRVSFIAASTDAEKQKVQPYVDEMGFTFPITYDEGNATKFGVEGIPSLFIIGPQGKIRYKIVGFDPDKDFIAEMNWRLESLLDS